MKRIIFGADPRTITNLEILVRGYRRLGLSLSRAAILRHVVSEATLLMLKRFPELAKPMPEPGQMPLFEEEK